MYTNKMMPKIILNRLMPQEEVITEEQFGFEKAPQKRYSNSEIHGENSYDSNKTSTTSHFQRLKKKLCQSGTQGIVGNNVQIWVRS